MKAYFYVILILLMILVGSSVGAPEPSLIQQPGNWTVDVKYEDPQQIEIRTKGERKPLRFWYTIITVTNKTNHDVDFYPKSELMTDTFEVIGAGWMTPAVVFKNIKLRHQSKYPFLELLEQSSHKILQGQDNTKDIAIIWPDFDAKARNIKLFIAGLSNETAVVDHPVKNGQDGKPLRIFLRKTLELSYKVSGDPAFRSDARLIPDGQSWVMR